MAEPTRDAPATPAASPKAPQRELNDRMAFLGLSEADAEQLRALKPAFAKFADQFVSDFYAHLFSFEDTAAFLQDPERVARLKKLQRDYFDSLLDARWDADYVANRNRIGQTHADVGLPPQFFLGAYNLYVQHSFRGFAAEHGPIVRQFAEQLLPLVKVILLDVGLTLDAYFHQAMQKLRQALDMYWRANDDLRRFAQLTSHDLKTPLSTVANLCDEVLDEFGDRIPAEARELIRSARDRTFQNSRMIDELLASTLSMRETQRGEMYSVDEVLREALDQVAPAASVKGIELRAPGNMPTAWGNKVRLREALSNLIGNAVKFSDKPHGRVEIHAQRQGDEVLISVADNGPGIPVEELERVFVPFRRLPGHRHLPGSGLGLYFTKQLIEAEGGHIWVESEPGAGARFSLLLPASPQSRLVTAGA